MLTLRVLYYHTSYYYHFNADLSCPKCVFFVRAVQRGDLTCDRASPSWPGKGLEKLTSGKVKDLLIVLWSVIFSSNKKQWDETDLVWHSVVKCSSLEGPGPLWKLESLQEMMIELMWYLEDICLPVKWLSNNEQSENVHISRYLLVATANMFFYFAGPRSLLTATKKPVVVLMSCKALIGLFVPSLNEPPWSDWMLQWGRVAFSSSPNGSQMFHNYLLHFWFVEKMTNTLHFLWLLHNKSQLEFSQFNAFNVKLQQEEMFPLHSSSLITESLNL